MTIFYFIFLLLLFVFIGCSYLIHGKRTGSNYMDSYRWYVKLLK